MFANQEAHECGIKARYNENMKGKRISFKERKRLSKRGATLKNPVFKLDVKLKKCYPRGPAFLRLVYLHSCGQLLGR